MIAILVFVPLLFSAPLYFIGKKNETARDICAAAFTGCVLALAILQFLRAAGGQADRLVLSQLAGGLSFRADGFRAMFALVASFLWFVTTLLSPRYFASYQNRNRYWFFTMLTLSGTMGVFLSDDLLTTFAFFELMSVASYAWVAHDEKPESLKAAATYLGLSIFGGMVTLLGLMLLQHSLGSLSFSALTAGHGTGVAGALVLVGFSTKAGVFPLHVWLPKSHPVAPAPASALLSGILTKTGVFGILIVATRLYAGQAAAGNVLLTLGLLTMSLGAVMAVFSVNIKRILACSSLSQIGYILTGIACGVLLGGNGSLAMSGAVSHMVNHSMFKLLLFGAAGVIYMNSHTLSLSQLRGFGKGKPLLAVTMGIGALGIAGVPLLSGYASKTMIHEALVECAEFGGIYRAAEWVFLIAAGLTTAYMLKLFVAIFLEDNPDESRAARFRAANGSYAGRACSIALALPAALIVLLGVVPGLTLLRAAGLSMPFLLEPETPDIALFTGTNLLGGGISIAIGCGVYFLFIRPFLRDRAGNYVDRWPAWLDLERIVRDNPVTRCVLRGFGRVMEALDGIVTELRFLGVAFCAILRVLDELTDEVVMVLRALFFRRHTGDAPRPASIFTRMSDVVYTGAVHALSRLPHIRRRDATDMRYGTSVTNAISFGLLIGAMGIIAALIYILIASA